MIVRESCRRTGRLAGWRRRQRRADCRWRYSIPPRSRSSRIPEIRGRVRGLAEYNAGCRRPVCGRNRCATAGSHCREEIARAVRRLRLDHGAVLPDEYVSHRQRAIPSTLQVTWRRRDPTGRVIASRGATR